MKIINMTPRTVRVVHDGKTVMEYPPSGKVTTFRDATVPFRLHPGIPVYHEIPPKVEGLPEPERDTLYIVFSDIRKCNPDRLDLISTAGMQQSDDHEICICRHFRINPPNRAGTDWLPVKK